MLGYVFLIEYNKRLDRQQPCLEDDLNGGSNNIVQSNKSVWFTLFSDHFQVLCKRRLFWFIKMLESKNFHLIFRVNKSKIWENHCIMCKAEYMSL